MMIIKCSVPTSSKAEFHFCNNTPLISCLRCKVVLCGRHYGKHPHQNEDGKITYSEIRRSHERKVTSRLVWAI